MTTSTSNTSLAGLSSIVGNYDLAGVPTLPTLMAPSLTAAAAAANAAAFPIAKPAMTLAQIGNKALVSTVDLLAPEDWEDDAGAILFMPLSKLSVAAVQHLRKREGMAEDPTLKAMLDAAAATAVAASTATSCYRNDHLNLQYIVGRFE